jgi:hypothetical protein
MGSCQGQNGHEFSRCWPRERASLAIRSVREHEAALSAILGRSEITCLPNSKRLLA